MPINQPSGESASENTPIPKDIFQRAKWEMAQMGTIFERDAERRQRIKADTSLSGEERKQKIEAVRETERSEVAALFDRLGVYSKDEKVRAKQALQGPVKPAETKRKAA